jgi:hypothetical protein
MNSCILKALDVNISIFLNNICVKLFFYVSAAQFLIHEFGGEEEFGLKIEESVQCLTIEYFSIVEVTVSTEAAEFYLPVCKYCDHFN